MLISVLNDFIDNDNKYICVSRPRRFGKTIASNMLCAYYSKGCDSREMFKKLKISKAKNFEKYLNKFNFIKIDVASAYQNANVKNDALVELTDFIRDEFKAQFPSVRFADNDTMANCIHYGFFYCIIRQFKFCRYGGSFTTIARTHPVSNVGHHEICRLVYKFKDISLVNLVVG